MPETTATTATAAAAGGSYNAVQFIQTRRQQEREHTDDEISWWISSFAAGIIPDYQMSAWLMAVCLNGLSQRETATLTRCMTESGVRLEWRNSTTTVAADAADATATTNNNDIVLVDKHSSGGIGDKVSIILAPLVATFGVSVPMMAGRGLAHTGGTIDKLESIPGFRTDLAVDEFQRIVRDTGCCITAAGPTLCRADQKMYALRDVTSTVTSLPLQTASILCKKIAEHPDSLVLDVKYGVGSFNPSLTQATELAVRMVETAEANGLSPTTAFLTRMDHPVGRGVGNWLEIQECIQIMKGTTTSCFENDDEQFRLSQDLITLVTWQAAQMLLQSGRFSQHTTFTELVQLATERLASGAVLDKFAEMVQAQGGDSSVIIGDESNYPFDAQHVGEWRAPMTTTTTSTTSTMIISNINALTVGQVAVELGAGRHVAGEPVDASAGIWFHAQVGDQVEPNSLIAQVYTNRGPAVLQACLERLRESIEFVDKEHSSVVVVPPIISHRVTKAGVEPMMQNAL